MEVLEQPDFIPKGIDLQAVEVILERIERTYTPLEEGCVRFMLQISQQNLGRLIIPALLHHLAVMYDEARLDVTVGIHNLAEGFCQFLSIHVLETEDMRDVVLRGVTVHLPVDIHATLVLSQRIILLKDMVVGKVNLSC